MSQSNKKPTTPTITEGGEIDPAPFADTLPPVLSRKYPRIRVMLVQDHWQFQGKSGIFSSWEYLGKGGYLRPFYPHKFTTERKAEMYARWWRYKQIVGPASKIKELL